jgi:hypothetical protein
VLLSLPRKHAWAVEPDALRHWIAGTDWPVVEDLEARGTFIPAEVKGNPEYGKLRANGACTFEKILYPRADLAKCMGLLELPRKG